MAGTDAFKFCPRCGAELTLRQAHGERPLEQSGRRGCPREGCGFIDYKNPLPVVAAIVEHEGKVLLVRAKGWPEKMYGLVTGFLESGEAPEAGILREVKEELGLEGEVVSLVGAYTFDLRNELIVAYHVKATGTVAVGDELEGYKAIEPGKLRPWPFGTGHAVSDWLARRQG
jgi:NAD+ diphosphatase